MSALKVYLGGATVVVLLAAGLGAAAMPAWRGPILVGGLVAALVQLPLGLWLVHALGRPGFLGVWGLGMVARLGTLALGAWVVAPVTGLALTPLLLAMVSVLVGLLGVECAAVLWATRGTSSEGT
ncbi:MAG TPA: hypothetical protein VFS07_07780 [Gemmatimonadales bacterium]|nr:hypothetical protein [Gemmatimonadales bacterium]